MGDFSKFRSALNGFNRSDVAAYIEQICAEHSKALEAEQKKSAALAGELEQAREVRLQQQAQLEALQEQLEQTETALQSTETALDEAMTLLTEEKEPEQPAEQDPDYASMELEAYRRAEAMERTAAERALRLQQQLSNVLDQVSARYEDAGQEIQVLTEDIRTNMKRLADTLSDLDVIFDETSRAFETMDSADYIAAE